MNYYDAKRDTFSSYIWARDIGLTLPKTYEWYLRIELTSDGKFCVFNQTQEEKERRFSINFRAHSPEIMNNTYSIDFSNDARTIKGSFWEKDTVNYLDQHTASFFDHDNQCDISTDIFNMKNFIVTMEKRYGITFERKPVSLYATKGIDKRLVQAWVESL